MKPALLASGLILALVFGLTTACAPGPSTTADSPSASAAATAIPTAAAAVQTAVPAIRATAAAVAPTVEAAGAMAAGGLQRGDVQAAIARASGALGGLHFELEQTPPGAPPDQVTAVALRATDSGGVLKSLDRATIESAATATLTTLGQIFPRAILELSVRDASGLTLVSAVGRAGTRTQVTVSQ